MRPARRRSVARKLPDRGRVDLDGLALADSVRVTELDTDGLRLNDTVRVTLEEGESDAVSELLCALTPAAIVRAASLASHGQVLVVRSRMIGQFSKFADMKVPPELSRNARLL